MRDIERRERCVWREGEERSKKEERSRQRGKRRRTLLPVEIYVQLKRSAKGNTEFWYSSDCHLNSSSEITLTRQTFTSARSERTPTVLLVLLAPEQKNMRKRRREPRREQRRKTLQEDCAELRTIGVVSLNHVASRSGGG